MAVLHCWKADICDFDIDLALLYRSAHVVLCMCSTKWHLHDLYFSSYVIAWTWRGWSALQLQCLEKSTYFFLALPCFQCGLGIASSWRMWCVSGFTFFCFGIVACLPGWLVFSENRANSDGLRCFSNCVVKTPTRCCYQ